MAFDRSKIELLTPKVVKGKTALVLFERQKDVDYKSLQVGKQVFEIFPMPHNQEKKYALIPFSYYAQAEKKLITLLYDEKGLGKEEVISLEVSPGNYEQESIRVSSKKVNPQSPEVKKRVAQEYSEAMKIYTRVRPKLYVSKKFILPLHSKITSAYGKARLYNGSLKGYHSGTDFRAKMGTPVLAANEGRVVLVKKRFYSGGTVVLDHGEGIYTCYFHMSAFAVKLGEYVKRGAVLGKSGESGRVTGPHLHFSARIKGVQVDPLQLIELMNKNLLNGDDT